MVQFIKYRIELKRVTDTGKNLQVFGNLKSPYFETNDLYKSELEIID